MGRTFKRYLHGTTPFFQCSGCRTHLALSHHLESKNFRSGAYQAFLFSEAVNVVFGPRVDRSLFTGLHTVADIYCLECQNEIGWFYHFAFEESQKYKEGKFILVENKIAECRPVKDDHDYASGNSSNASSSSSAHDDEEDDDEEHDDEDDEEDDGEDDEGDEGDDDEDDNDDEGEGEHDHEHGDDEDDDEYEHEHEHDDDPDHEHGHGGHGPESYDDDEDDEGGHDQDDVGSGGGGGGGGSNPDVYRYHSDPHSAVFDDHDEHDHDEHDDHADDDEEAVRILHYASREEMHRSLHSPWAMPSSLLPGLTPGGFPLQLLFQPHAHDPRLPAQPRWHDGDGGDDDDDGDDDDGGDVARSANNPDDQHDASAAPHHGWYYSYVPHDAYNDAVRTDPALHAVHGADALHHAYTAITSPAAASTSSLASGSPSTASASIASPTLTRTSASRRSSYHEQRHGAQLSRRGRPRGRASAASPQQHERFASRHAQMSPDEMPFS